MQPIDQPDIETLLHHLQSADTTARQQAAIELSRVQDARVVEPLLQALRDPDSSVRASAAAGLGTNRAAQAIDALVAVLREDPSEVVRERAVTALAQIGEERVIDPLIDALDDPATFTRNRAIYVLGASGDARVVEPLIVLLDHPEPSTQGVAAWALGAIGDPRALEPLLELLHHPEPEVRGNAAWALGELADSRAIDPLIDRLTDEHPEVRGKTAWALGALGELSGETRVVAPLIDLLEDFTRVQQRASAHQFVCQYAAEALVQIGTDEAKAAVEAWQPRARDRLLSQRIADLIAVFRQRDTRRTDEAVSRLVEIGEPAVPALLEALDHENPRVRQGAARALGAIGNARAVPRLTMALADPDPGVWSQSAAALAKLGEAAQEPLRLALRSRKRRVQLGAAVALWRITREEEAFPLVLQAVQDDEVVVRASAITSLWMQPDKRAVATLQIQLQGEVEMVARYILQALQAIGTPAAQATIQHWLQQHQG